MSRWKPEAGTGNDRLKNGWTVEWRRQCGCTEEESRRKKIQEVRVQKEEDGSVEKWMEEAGRTNIGILANILSKKWRSGEKVGPCSHIEIMIPSICWNHPMQPSVHQTPNQSYCKWRNFQDIWQTRLQVVDS